MGAKAVEQGVIILEQGGLLVACARPVAQEPTRPELGLLLVARAKVAELDSTVIKLLNQVAKAVKQGDILPQRGPPRAPRVQDVQPDDILPQRGQQVPLHAQGVHKGATMAPRARHLLPPAQAVPLGSRVTISRWQCLAPRIWWCRTHSVPTSMVRMAWGGAIMIRTPIFFQRAVFCIPTITSTTTVTQGPHPRVARLILVR